MPYSGYIYLFVFSSLCSARRGLTSETYNSAFVARHLRVESVRHAKHGETQKPCSSCFHLDGTLYRATRPLKAHTQRPCKQPRCQLGSTSPLSAPGCSFVLCSSEGLCPGINGKNFCQHAISTANTIKKNKQRIK